MAKYFHVGNVRAESPVLLAPMCGYTDLPFRLAVRRFGGLGLAFTEMIDARSVVYGGGRRREAILASCPEDRPLCYQVCGNDAALMAEAALWLVENRNASMIDINMGCPQRKITGRGAGAGLLRDPAAAVKLAATVVNAVPVPVSVKLRLGLNDADPLLAARIAPALEQAGVAAITVHGRTLAQRYAGNSNRNAIREVVKQVRRIPVIGNGDIESTESARTMLKDTGCAAVMIGRAALKRPWIISDVARALERSAPVSANSYRPSRGAHIDFMLRHFDAFVRHYGGGPAALMFRRWIPHYAKALALDRQRMIELLQIADNNFLRAELAAV